MEPLLTQITHYLFRQSWHIALLITAVATVSYLARNRSAHVRYLLWLIVLAKCLVPPLYTATPLEAPPLSLELIEAARPQPYISPALAPAAPMPEPVTPSRPTIAHQLSKVTLREWLALGWVVGASLFVLVALIKAWRTNRWLRRDRCQLPDNLKAKVGKFFCDLGIKTRPKVWLITGVGQPFVWGMLRGSIYLPGKFEQVNGPAGWRGVLGHELSHVMRFDAAVNFLQVISQAVYWFHPLVWWANRKLREEREKCCDEMAIARLNTRPKDYSTAQARLRISRTGSRPL
jgi:beta-lactamase regulating signal transducer with metallopeptidase domain